MIADASTRRNLVFADLERVGTGMVLGVGWSVKLDSTVIVVKIGRAFLSACMVVVRCHRCLMVVLCYV